MSFQKKQHESSEYVRKLFIDGKNLERSNQSVLSEITGDMKSKKKKQMKIKKGDLSMPECQAVNKKKISNGKSNSSKKNIRNMKSLKTSEVESILNEKVSIESLTASLKDLAKRSLSRQKTGCVDLDLSFSKPFLGSLIPNSKLMDNQNQNRLNKNLRKICSQLLLSLRRDTTEKENITYCRKVRVYPTTSQKEYFNKCFGTTRYIYNKCVEHYQKKGKIDLVHMRTKIMGKDKDLNQANLWLKDIPYDSRQQVIRNFIGGYNAGMSNLKNGNIKSFSVSFLSKKNKTQRMYIDSRGIDINLNMFKRRKIGECRTRKKYKKWLKDILKSIDKTSTLIRTGKRYYLCIVDEKKKKNIKKAPQICVALDPGARTFQTFFGEKTHGKIGDHFRTEILKQNKKISLLTSLRAKCEYAKKRYRLKRKLESLRSKVTNKVSNLHWQTASWLVKNFSIIFIPKFSAKQVTNKSNRNIGKQVSRDLYDLAHYSFRQRLKYLAGCYKDRYVFECDEAYSTKICNSCLYLNNTIGAKKSYKCPNCKKQLDRDLNASINIMMFQLSRLNAHGFEAIR